MQSFNSWISEPLQNLIFFEDGSECGATKYQQMNQFIAPFCCFPCFKLYLKYGTFYILLRVSRIVHSLRNVLAKLIWRGYLETWKTSYLNLKHRIYQILQ